MDTEIEGGSGVIVTAALAVAVDCATLWAVTVTASEGTDAGAV